VTASAALLLAAPCVPAAAALAVAFVRGSGWLRWSLALAPVPALAAAGLPTETASLMISPDRLRLGLALDHPAAILLGATALLWCAAGAFAAISLGQGKRFRPFAACWLLTLSGSIGCTISQDLPGFYLFFTLASLPAFGLVVHDGSRAAWRAGGIYLLLAIAGEVFQLFAFAMLAALSPGESLAIADCLLALRDDPRRHAVLALLVAGFGVKAGLVPLHVWLPLAHPAAPAPASSVLSGAIIKAGLIGLLRFVPAVADPGWGEALVGAGLLTALYGALLGLTQLQPKTVLAYSSVSQMGLLVAALGCGVALAAPGAPLSVAVAAVHHVMAKGALFLAVAVRALLPGRLVLVVAAVLGAGFGGLPVTGGHAGKLALKELFTARGLALPTSVAAAASTALMLHFAHRLAATQAAGRPADARARACDALWLLLAAASVLLPWWLLRLTDAAAAAKALDPVEVGQAFLPVLVGAVVAALRTRVHLPAVPPGDVLVLAERVQAMAPVIVAASVRMEQLLSGWATSIVLIALLALLLAALMLLSV
jgi:formate hydrogenlyase subunit 3/multisubunit Na+/H+ antiporter MnhD subunit